MSTEIQTTIADPTATQPLVAVDDSDNAALMDSAKFGQLQRAAKLFASSTMVPSHFQGNMANCFIAMQMAARLGVDPFMFMQKCYVVHGKPGLEAQLLIAMANARGPFRGRILYRMEGQGDSWSCTAYATLEDTGDVVEATVSIAMAKKMGWTTKKDSMWLKMPEQMLKYRSATYLIRTICPEVIMGLYEAEEVREMEVPQVRQLTTADIMGEPNEKVGEKVIEADVLPAPQSAAGEPQAGAAESAPTTGEMSPCDEYLAYIEEAGTKEELDNIYVMAESGQMPAGELEILRGAIAKRKAYLSRGERSNTTGEQ